MIVGFVSKAQAETIAIEFEGVMVNLWSVIAGSDMIDLGGGPNGEPDGIPDTPGVWVFFNFTAERVRVFAKL